MYPLHLLMFSQDFESRGGTTSARAWWWMGGLLCLVLAAAVLGRCLFFVDETQYAYVTQFGSPVRFYTEPGLGLKWPYQSLWRFDRRLQIYEPPAREMLTEDKENLNFEWFVCWRIPDHSFASQPGHDDLETYVKRFLQAVGTMQTAENRLEERVQAAIAAEIGRTRLGQLVSLDPSALALKSINEQVTESVQQLAADQFGIEVVDVRLKRFNYPNAVKPAVYSEIRSERERVAVQYRAEGASQKAKVESLANLQRDRLLAQAQREATTIRGQGEARAIEIFNAAHGKDPQFYQLLKTLETYRSILDDQTTVVLSAESPLLKLLTRGFPEMNIPPAKLPSSEQEKPVISPATSNADGTSDDTRIATQPGN